MDLFCRLCAKVKHPSELNVVIDDPLIHQKLIECCRWNALKQNDNFPQSVCNLCSEKLQKCWEFVQCVENAQTELAVHFLKEETVNTDYEEVLVEMDSDDGIVEIPQIKTESFYYLNEDNSDHLKLNEAELLQSKVKPPVTNGTSSRDKTEGEIHSQPSNAIENDDFLSNFSSSDFDPKGTIKQEKIDELQLSDWATFGYKCWMCQETFGSHDDLVLHFDATHTNEQPKCICTVCTDNTVLLSDKRGGWNSYHVTKYHVPHLKYCCFKCQKFFWNKEIMTKHVRNHSSEGKCFRCKLCRKGFSKAYGLAVHQNAHRPKHLKRVYECYLCKKPYNSKEGIRFHMKTHYGNCAIYCERCGLKLKSHRNLKKHLITHLEDRNFNCDECSKSFKEAGALRKHKRIHTKEQPYVCQDCNKRFSLYSSLFRHKRIHSGTLPYSCHECPKKFRTSTSLITHRRVHTGEKPFQCEECEYRSGNRSNLRKHMKTQHGKTLGRLSHK